MATFLQWTKNAEAMKYDHLYQFIVQNELDRDDQCDENALELQHILPMRRCVTNGTSSRNSSYSTKTCVYCWSLSIGGRNKWTSFIIKWVVQTFT